MAIYINGNKMNSTNTNINFDSKNVTINSAPIWVDCVSNLPSTGSASVYVDLETGHKWSYSNGTWNDGGLYQANGIADGSIFEKNLSNECKKKLEEPIQQENIGDPTILEADTSLENTVYYTNNNNILTNTSSNMTATKYIIPASGKLTYSGMTINSIYSPTLIFANSSNPTKALQVIQLNDSTTSWVYFENIEVIPPSDADIVYANFRKIATYSNSGLYNQDYKYSVGYNNLTKEVQNRIKVNTKPTILFIFDASAYDDRAKILENNGFHGTFTICINGFNTPKNAMHTLVKNGHDIGLYRGGSLETEPSIMSDDWDSYIKGGLDELAENGFYLPTMYGCHSHKTSTTINNACEKYGIKYVSAITDYYDDVNYTIHYEKDNAPDKLVMRPITMPNLTYEQIKAKIDNAVLHNYHISLFTHLIYEDGEIFDTYTNMLKSIFTQVVQYCKQLAGDGIIDVMTMREFYNKYHSEDGKNRDYNRCMMGMISNYKVSE